MSHFFEVHVSGEPLANGVRVRSFEFARRRGREGGDYRVIASATPFSLGTKPTVKKSSGGCWLCSMFLVLACALTALLSVGCRPKQAPSVPPRVVKLHTVGAEQCLPGPSYSGVVQSVNRATLSFQVGGRIEFLPTEMGDQVAQGQLLARLDPAPFELRVKQAEADVQGAKAVLSEKQRRFEAEKRLLPEGATTQTEYDQIEEAVAMAKSRLEVAEAALRLANRDRENTRLVAPMAGRIARRNFQNFAEVGSGMPVFELDGDGEVEVSVAVPEDFKLQAGTAVDVRLKASRTLQVPGEVTRIGSRSDSANTIPVLVRLKKQTEAIRTGTAAEVVFANSDQTSAPIIPALALMPGKEANTAAVYVFSNGTVTRRAVSLGQPVANGFSVSGGLVPGERIVAAGVTFLTNGQAVRPMPDSDQNSTTLSPVNSPAPVSGFSVN